MIGITHAKIGVSPVNIVFKTGVITAKSDFCVSFCEDFDDF